MNVADGTIDWTDPISPDEETSTPIVLAHGGVDMFAYDAQTMDAVFTFDPATGASTSTTFGFSLYYAPGDLAVGADGSLYVTHEDGVGDGRSRRPTSRASRRAAPCSGRRSTSRLWPRRPIRATGRSSRRRSRSGRATWSSSRWT